MEHGHRSSQEHAEVFRCWSECGPEEDWSAGTVQSTQNFSTISAFPAITNVPIRLQGKVIDNVFASWNEIFDSLKHYYLKETLSQIYKIIGSLDFVGSEFCLFCY